MTCLKAEQKEESRAAKAPGFLRRSLGQHHLIGVEVIERNADQRDWLWPKASTRSSFCCVA